jgi:hypothetical protein
MHLVTVDNKASGLKPEDQGLAGPLCALADALRAELSGGENPCAAFTKFVAEAFQREQDADYASRLVLELFAQRRDTLAAYTRVVDVANELKVNSCTLAKEVIAAWDLPKEEHKLARLADELLASPELFTNAAALSFIPELARRLALQRPELAVRLIDLLPETESGLVTSAVGTVRAWVKTGEFLRTQTEAVRYFWIRHLRSPSQPQDLTRMNVRPALQAVQTAEVDREVLALLRESIPVDVWASASQPVVAVVQSVPAASVNASREAPPQRATASVPISLRPACLGSVQRLNARGASVAQRRSLPWARIAAGVLICGLAWVFVGRQTDSSKSVVVAVVHPDSVSAVTHMPKPVKTTATSVAVVTPVKKAAAPQPAPKLVVANVPAVPAAPARPKASTPPEKSPVVASAPTPSPKQLTTEGLLQTLTLPKPLSFAKPVAKASSRPPLKQVSEPPPSVTRAPTSLLPPRIESAPVAPAPPQESVAKPMALTGYDRWALAQTRDLSARFPELVEMQQAVVKGNWTDSTMKLDGVRPITADRERYLALLRWLVIDPPLPAETHRIVLRTWAREAPTEECIALWEEITSKQASHSADIAAAARIMLAQSASSLTADQQARLSALSSLR